MKWNPRLLLILPLVAATSAGTVTLAQKAADVKPTVAGEFVKVDGTYLRVSRIDSVSIADDSVHVCIAGKVGDFELKECGDLFKALGLPPIDTPKAER